MRKRGPHGPSKSQTPGTKGLDGLVLVDPVDCKNVFIYPQVFSSTY